MRLNFYPTVAVNFNTVNYSWEDATWTGHVNPRHCAMWENSRWYFIKTTNKLWLFK